MVMGGRIILILAGFGLAATSATAQAPAEPDTEMKALLDSCDAHKFETMVVVDASRGKKVKICGKPGQTDADWLATLKDSVSKVKADQAMAPLVKEQILDALAAEIGRLEQVAATTAPSVGAAPVATIAVTANPVSTPEAPPQYSSVPQLPAPKRRATTVQAGGGTQASAPSAPLIRPRLTIRCGLPREGLAACARLERATQLVIRAEEDMAAGTSLRFLRGGDNRAELDLSALRKGELLREKLPGRVCSGVLRGKVQVQILSKSRVAETLGPYALYCGS
jgi:hypothetical protein